MVTHNNKELINKYLKKNSQELIINIYLQFANQIKKKKRFICISLLLINFSIEAFSQVGINTEIPHETSDLTLGSSDKGLLPNRVALESINSPAPLKSTIPNGTIVYNTQPNDIGLEEGLHIWEGENWGRLLTTLGKRTDFKILLFKKTADNDEKVLRYSTNPATVPSEDEISALGGEFSVERDGTVMINAVLYAKLQIKSKMEKYAFVGNTFFKIVITDNTTGTSTTFITACTPVSTANAKTFADDTSWVTVNNNPEGALCQGSLNVIKGHNYSIKVYGQEGWVTTAIGTVKAGTYVWGQYRAYSTLRLDYVSEPY